MERLCRIQGHGLLMLASANVANGKLKEKGAIAVVDPVHGGACAALW